MTRAAELSSFLAAYPEAIVAELTSVRGSSPREAGAFMVVGASALAGTIGGGALEHMVVARARQALRDGLPPGAMDVPLGPEIGQCCGGRVTVTMRVLTPALGELLRQRLAAAEAGWPHVFIHGAGHVGKALARALVPLPLQVHVIDTRASELTGLPEGVEVRAVAMPESVVRSAPAGTSHVIVTHDHALDFMIAAEALARDDAPYVGMVGSRTKRARFASWYREQGGTVEALERLVLPIGAAGVVDKRPEVIAALAAAEIFVHIGHGNASGVRPDSGTRSGAAVD